MTISSTQERIRQLGATIQTHRVAQSLSQDRLAKMAGTEQAVIARIEAGRWNTRIATYIAIADALGMRLSDLVDF